MRYHDELIAYDKAHHIKHNQAITQSLKKQVWLHNQENVVYKPERVEQVIDFIEAEFRQTKGQLTPIKLQPTQKWWLEIIFGYYDQAGNNLINEVFINIIRGAGKSTLMAGLVITWMLLSDNYGGEGQVIAYDNKQADEVYGQVVKQLQAGGDVIQFLSNKQSFKLDGKHINMPVQLRKTREGIKFEQNQNTFKKQTNDESTVQGGNTVLNIFDEVHTYKKLIAEPVNMGSRKQPSWRSIYITSGGITRDGQYDALIKQFTSEDYMHDLHTFGFIYRLDDASEVTDESNWTKAAPMIGVVPTWEKVRREYNNAKDDPALQTRFLAYNMGVQTSDTVYFIPDELVHLTEYDEHTWDYGDAYMGVDVSYSGDWTSIAYLMNKGGLWYLHVESLTTRDSLEEMPTELKQQVQRFEGHGLTVIERDRIKADDIYAVASEFIDEHRLHVEKLGYDRYNYDELHDRMDNYLYDVDDSLQRPIKQGFHLSESVNLLKRLLAQDKLYVDQPVVKWALHNLAVRMGTSGDVMMKKLNYYNKIDPVAAAVFALEVSK